MKTAQCISKSKDEQKKLLYWNQKWLLDDFLKTGAITPAQYKKSLTCLTEKMGMEGQPEPKRQNRED